jgi:hypothetical protein
MDFLAGPSGALTTISLPSGLLLRRERLTLQFTDSTNLQTHYEPLQDDRILSSI